MNHTTISTIAEDSSIDTLVSYGALFGCIHILTAPDHISIMITISANKGICAFFTGLKWGLGHSIGLFIIYSVFLSIDKNILSKSHIVEWIVGFVLILLGFHGFYKVRRYHKNLYKIAILKNQDQIIIQEKQDVVAPTHVYIAKLIQESVLSLIIGVLHGLAGSGGILGVLPAIMVEDKEKSIAYLGMFCITGIVTMGAFSALWGELSAKFTRKMGIILLYVSSLFSIIIGILWIALLASDNMENILGDDR